MINGDLNNNELVLASFFISCLFVGKNWLRKKHSSLLFILMLCLSGERKQSGIGERKKGDLSPFLKESVYV